MFGGEDEVFIKGCFRLLTCALHQACIHERGKSGLGCGRLATVPIASPVSVSVSVPSRGRGLPGSSLSVLLGLHGFELPGVLVALIMGLCLVLQENEKKRLESERQKGFD